jgi:rubrerythrin
MAKQFSGCEIAELGVQVEKNGKDYYMKLIDLAETEKAKSVFRDLADQEEKHIEVFRKIFDSSCNYKPEGAYPDEYFSYMNALASQYVFTQKGKGAEIASGLKNCSEGIEMGIGFEKDSILLYQQMRELVPEEDRSLVDGLIEEEKKHLARLMDLKKGCSA